MLSNNPNAINPKAQMFMNQEQIKDTPVRIRPKINAFLGVILPDGMGLPLVLSIIASISLSLYPVRVSAAAEPAAIAKKSNAQVHQLTGTSNNHDAETAAPIAVKTSKYQIFGLVSS